ncbi:hypothetical protein JCM10213_000261 [Rhodosporidiobolus nylandii]
MPVDRQSVSPLLGDKAFPSFAPSSSRRLRILWPVVIVAGVLTASAAFHSGGVPSALEPLKDRIQQYVSYNDDSAPPVRWSVEDRELRNYTWATPPVHSSLQQIVDSLTPAQRRTREWLASARVQSEGGTGIGLGAADPPRAIKGGQARAHRYAPGQGEGPGLYTSGSRAKYYDLVHEWTTGRQAEACEHNQWEANYTRMHKEMISGEREPWVLEFVCHEGGFCGGYADRMLGIISTFLYSIISNRAFFMRWEHPAPPDLIFDSPNIDWSRPFNTSSTTEARAPFNNMTFGSSIQAHNWDWQLDQFFPKFYKDYAAETGGAKPWVTLDVNRGVVFRSFYYDTIIPRLEELGIKFTTAYACLIKYLFRPKPAVLKFISQYTSLFSLPEYFVVGVQVRTGDASMFCANCDKHTVGLYKQYFDCADALAKRYAHPSQKKLIYLITDSNNLEEDALKTFNGSIVVTGLEQSHDELKYMNKNGTEVVHTSLDGYMRTVAESFIFSNTDYQILTQRSGFGKIPTWQRGKDHTTVVMFNPYLDLSMTNRAKAANGGKLPPPLDCSKPKALTSFADLALDWSLG